ncbi:hypothetical protein LTR53_001376 [Teratosphaeriaceae sp. CCFEE 6253]|nr:hypothetical protein LTR53_001376 [Teratosphaeriaceae sp. CCFEE 6253]
MGGDKAIYIVTVGGGKCLENTASASGVLDCLPKPHSASQHWVLEPADTPNVVAFRSCADGRYLRNTEPAKISGARIGVGAERQWWTLERGATPGSCLIRSNACTAGQSYLNDFQGKYQDKNYVHMWQMEKSLEFWLNWYLVDADSASFNPVDGAAGQDSSELEKREKTLAEREERVKAAEGKSKAVAKREAAAKRREDEVARKERDLRSREAELAGKKQAPPAAQETTKAAGKDEAEKREAALRKREKDVVAKEKEASQVEQKTKALGEEEAALTKREQDLAAREKATPKQANTSATRKPSPAKAEPAPPPKPQSPERAAGAASYKRDLDLLRAAHERLQTSSESTVRRLRGDAANLRQQLDKSRHAAESRMAVLGSHSKAIVWTCGHKAYPLPRKLERKVVGIVYEGLEYHDKGWGGEEVIRR